MRILKGLFLGSKGERGDSRWWVYRNFWEEVENVSSCKTDRI